MAFVTRRRLTWILHNGIMSIFIPFRFLLLVIIRIGEVAEWIGLRTPGWRRFDGWTGW